MTIEIGGHVFKGLKWTRENARSYTSGPYALWHHKLCGWDVVVADKLLARRVASLRDAKRIANDNARAALAFGSRPVTIR